MRVLGKQPRTLDYDGTDLEERVTDWLSRQVSSFSLADALILGALLIAMILFAVARLH
jgi:hypothetical protein